MYLFFNGVSSKWYIGLFDEHQEYITSEEFEIQGNESTKVIPIVDNFLTVNNISYTDLKNIVVVVWPGSFTWIRSISLVVNTLSYIYPHIYLTPISFFDLYSRYPIMKISSKRDVFVKYSESDMIQIVKNEDIELSTIEKIYWDIESERLSNDREIDSTIDYKLCMKNIVLKNTKIVSPLYIKKPNIS